MFIARVAGHYAALLDQPGSVPQLTNKTLATLPADQGKLVRWRCMVTDTGVRLC